MIKYFAILLFFLTQFAAAAVKGELVFNGPEVKQGAIEEAKILLGPEAAQKLQLQKLKGQTLGNTLYVYEISPLVRREGGSAYEADAKVIFIKVPEGQGLTFKEGTEDIVLSWNHLTVTPTEGQGLIYEKFSIPSRPKLIFWSLCILGILVVGVLGRSFYKKQVAKKSAKARLFSLKQELMIGNDYQEIVTIWMKRADFLKAFPHIEAPFREFETTLFKYQFKPTQSEVEKNIVLEAYRKFLSQISGGFDGI